MPLAVADVRVPLLRQPHVSDVVHGFEGGYYVDRVACMYGIAVSTCPGCMRLWQHLRSSVAGVAGSGGTLHGS